MPEVSEGYWKLQNHMKIRQNQQKTQTARSLTTEKQHGKKHKTENH